MPLLMLEPIVDLMLTQLQTYLPAKITALQPTFLPLLEMPAPVDYVFDDRNEFLKGYPVIQVRQVSTPIVSDDLRWQEHYQRVEVGVWIQRAEPDYLSRLTDRYVRCVVETLHERRKAGAFYDAAGMDLHLKGEDISYTPTLSQTGMFVRGVFIPMRFERRDVERH